MENVDYSKFYWQNELVRLRPIRMDDWKEHYYNLFDNEARFFLDSEIELPFNEEIAEQHFKNWLGEGFDNNNRIRLTIETLEGINVDSTAITRNWPTAACARPSQP